MSETRKTDEEIRARMEQWEGKRVNEKDTLMLAFIGARQEELRWVLGE